jgi:cytochrome P450
MVVLDMFVAGSTTTSTALDFTFLYLALNPHIQEKAFQEINSIIGTQQAPKMVDQSRCVIIPTFFYQHKKLLIFQAALCVRRDPRSHEAELNRAHRRTETNSERRRIRGICYS